MVEIHTVCLSLPNSITQSQASRHYKEVRDVVRSRLPQPQDDQKAHIEGGASGDEGEAFDVATGADPNEDTTGGTDGSEAHHDRTDLGHAQCTGDVGLQYQKKNNSEFQLISNLIKEK